MAKQQSAFERLKTLPEVFRGANLTVRFQWSSKTASQYLYLWKKRGLVDALGGHSDVFVNLVVSQTPDWEKALLFAMPSAVVVGIEALRRAGWITQIPQRPEIAVNARHPRYSLPQYVIVPKDAAWFATVRKNAKGNGLPVLAPAWALADLLQSYGRGGCGLQPDDIDWSATTPLDQKQWLAASKAFRLPLSNLVEEEAALLF